MPFPKSALIDANLYYLLGFRMEYYSNTQRFVGQVVQNSHKITLLISWLTVQVGRGSPIGGGLLKRVRHIWRFFINA
jgi:hypothetical protein